MIDAKMSAESARELLRHKLMQLNETLLSAKTLKQDIFELCKRYQFSVQFEPLRVMDEEAEAK